MKISNLKFVAGCACCQEHDVADIGITGGAVKIMRVPQESGSVAYIVLVNREGQPEQRHMKLTESEADLVMSKIDW